LSLYRVKKVSSNVPILINQIAQPHQHVTGDPLNAMLKCQIFSIVFH
jgi:hypothetical protein